MSTTAANADADADYHSSDGSVMPDVLAKGREACYKVEPSSSPLNPFFLSGFPLLTGGSRPFLPPPQARDAFYACVEKHADKKPTEIATMGLLYPADCKKSRANFVSNCRPTWVKHFDRQYCAKKRVQRLLDGDEDRRGPISLPQPYTFKQ
ncbi:hypothetical protein HU200_003056 [Digitaria exilis]|uniref:Uncharacterized protein n=1 Tax=Digitaria exilis TaxID=1010633 RepID=A0A835FX71_9POAL|nr:hypothetical protein HU200_003056 [Digitaria exilis]CAB3483088.1 unnamed protein product [Digitaria exilis]